MAELSKRKQQILNVIVETYITTGYPVGSKAISQKMDNAVSSATIRNEMAELVDLGYLAQPHTSAGRLPTQRAYRYYIDHLMHRQQMSAYEKQRIHNLLAPAWGDANAVLTRAADILAEMTQHAVISTTPADEQASIKRVELVPIGEKKAMIVLLSSSGILKNRLTRTSEPLTKAHVELFYNIMEQHFLNKRIQDIHTALLQTLTASLGEHALIMAPLLATVFDLSREITGAQVHLEGEMNLLKQASSDNEASMLLSFLQRQQPLEYLVFFPEENGNINIRIGTENMYKELAQSSVVLSPYTITDHVYGSLGIIGPTRMDYAKIITGLEYLTFLVGKFLEEAMED